MDIPEACDRPGVPATGPLVADALRLVPADGRRVVLGLTGPPGAGKSTLARVLVDAVNARLGAGTAALVPMDGFHLGNAELEARGRRHRKGAPDTFDVTGYLALLRTVVRETARPVSVPDFDREADEPVTGRLAVAPGARLVVTEGNYLALDAPGWRAVRPVLEELWYVDAPDGVRERRLVARQLAGGRNGAAARAWVRDSDGPNGELVKRTRERCDRVVRPPLGPESRG